jgi:hypothetical protein
MLAEHERILDISGHPEAIQERRVDDLTRHARHSHQAVDDLTHELLFSRRSVSGARIDPIHQLVRRLARLS